MFQPCHSPLCGTWELQPWVLLVTNGNAQASSPHISFSEAHWSLRSLMNRCGFWLWQTVRVDSTMPGQSYLYQFLWHDKVEVSCQPITTAGRNGKPTTDAGGQHSEKEATVFQFLYADLVLLRSTPSCSPHSVNSRLGLINCTVVRSGHKLKITVRMLSRNQVVFYTSVPQHCCSRRLARG